MGQATVRNINGKWQAHCGDDNLVAEDTTEEGLYKQLNDLGLSTSEQEYQELLDDQGNLLPSKS